MKLVPALHVSTWEREHAYPVEDARQYVSTSLENKEQIEELHELRQNLPVNFDNDVLAMIEQGDWLLIKADAYFFDWSPFEQMTERMKREQRIMDLMNNPMPQKELPPQRLFRITDSRTEKLLSHERCRVTVDGEDDARRIDGKGLTHVCKPAEYARISIQITP